MGYSQESFYESAIEAYDQMKRTGIEPDDFMTHGSLIACSIVAARADIIHASVTGNGFIF